MKKVGDYQERSVRTIDSLLTTSCGGWLEVGCRGVAAAAIRRVSLDGGCISHLVPQPNDSPRLWQQRSNYVTSCTGSIGNFSVVPTLCWIVPPHNTRRFLCFDSVAAHGWISGGTDGRGYLLRGGHFCIGGRVSASRLESRYLALDYHPRLYAQQDTNRWRPLSSTSLTSLHTAVADMTTAVPADTAGASHGESLVSEFVILDQVMYLP